MVWATGGSSTLSTLTISQIVITKTANTSFSISPSTVTKTCGTSLNQTFTANGTNIPAGATVSYTWNLGSTSNGWLYSGSAAPQTITTSANTLNLTAATCGAKPNNVSVTATVNGNNYSGGTATVSMPAFSISGAASFCGSQTYTIANLGCSATVNWSVTPSGIVSPSTGSGNSITLTKVSSGVITLTAAISNACGITTTLTKSNIRVGGFSSSEYPVSGSSTACTNQTVYFNTNTLPDATDYAWTWPSGWTYLSGQGTPYISLMTPSSSGSSGMVGVRVANACDAGGSPALLYVEVNSCFGFEVSPNPTNGELTVTTAEDETAPTTEVTAKSVSVQNKIYKIKLADQSGNVKKVFNFSGVKSARLNISTLHKGIYIISAYNGEEWSSKKIILQ